MHEVLCRNVRVRCQEAGVCAYLMNACGTRSTSRSTTPVRSWKDAISCCTAWKVLTMRWQLSNVTKRYPDKSPRGYKPTGIWQKPTHFSAPTRRAVFTLAQSRFSMLPNCLHNLIPFVFCNSTEQNDWQLNSITCIFLLSFCVFSTFLFLHKL